MPKSFAEKKDFKEKFVRGMAKDFGKELNFSEAIKNSFLLFQADELPVQIQEVFDAP